MNDAISRISTHLPTIIRRYLIVQHQKQLIKSQLTQIMKIFHVLQQTSNFYEYKMQPSTLHMFVLYEIWKNDEVNEKNFFLVRLLFDYTLNL